MVVAKNPTTNERGFYEKMLFKARETLLTSTNFEHRCSTNWAFAFHCRLAIFHGNVFWIFNISLCSTFHTIHSCCHIYKVTSSQKIRILLQRCAYRLKKQDDMVMFKITLYGSLSYITQPEPER